MASQELDSGLDAKLGGNVHGNIEPGALTTDSVLSGAVTFRQPSAGYRVNVDSVLLAYFAAHKPVECAADLGAGVGLVALVLWHLRAARRYLLVEKDRALAELGLDNLQRAGAPAELAVANVLHASELGAFHQRADLVVCNPPFYSLPSHQAAHHPQRAEARAGELAPFLRAANELLSGEKARAVFAYPAAGLAELLSASAALRLVPKRLRLVHSFVERPARLALLEFRRSRPGGLVVEAPLIEWQAPGQASAELSALNGRVSDRT
jgi:tRNA1Val (adenine37-N6)-methyltransferase